MKITIPARLAATAVCTMAASILAVPKASAAEAEPWFVQIGPARIAFSERVTLSVAGTEVPGAGAKLTDNTTLVADIGYRFTPEWSAAVTIGIPPTTKVSGTGTAEPFGQFGDVQYAPLGLTGRYQLRTGSVEPYVGAGAVYYIATRARDGAIGSLSVKNAWGSVIQIGAEVPLSKDYGLVLDVKKLFLKTSAAGVLTAAGGAPVKADITLNPLVVQVGLSVHF